MKERSHRISELIEGHRGLSQHRLQCLRRNLFVVWNRDVNPRLAHANVGAFLSNHRETQALKRSDSLGAGNISGYFHEVAKTGSVKKCRRTDCGACSSPKWQCTASLIIVSSS